VRRAAARAVTAAGFAGGLMAGLIVWTQQTHRFRHNLFSGHPWRRLAALGYLRGKTSGRSIRLLRDYVRWEQHPALRKRGERILRQMESSLQ
jgi:hypothetical protein